MGESDTARITLRSCIVLAFVVLLLIGLVAVTSASMPYSARVFNDTFYFAKRDAVYVLLSLATCYLTLQFLLLNGKSGTLKFSY